MKKHMLILGFLLALLLSGCGLGQPAPADTPTLVPPTQTPEPSLTPLPPTPTLEPSPTEALPTATLAPTDTVQPSPALSSTATSPPAATSAPATRQATATPTRTPKGFQPTNTRPPAATAGPSRTPTPVQADIVGVTWYWTSLRKADGTTVNVEDPDRYTLLLKADGTVSMRADCNTAAGSYRLRNSKLTVDLRTGTTKDCGDNSGSPLFTNTIEGASSYDIYNDGSMEIFLEDGGVMRFSK